MKLKETSLSWALKHVCKEGDTDLFPQPFEFDIIKKYWPTVLKAVQINEHRWHGPRRLIVPKSEYGFRTVCQLDPQDSILFAALHMGRDQILIQVFMFATVLLAAFFGSMAVALSWFG
jgi:hypothetical protein